MWEFAQELLKEYGLVGVISLAVCVGLYKIVVKALTLIKSVIDTYHKEAVGAIRDIGTKIDTLTVTTAEHGIEIEYGSKEFGKISLHQDKQDDKIHKLSNEVHSIKNKMITQETMKILLENK